MSQTIAHVNFTVPVSTLPSSTGLSGTQSSGPTFVGTIVDSTQTKAKTLWVKVDDRQQIPAGQWLLMLDTKDRKVIISTIDEAHSVELCMTRVLAYHPIPVYPW